MARKRISSLFMMNPKRKQRRLQHRRKKQTGGALQRRRGPSTVDKIGWALSTIITPEVSLQKAGEVLLGQAIKGITDQF